MAGIARIDLLLPDNSRANLCCVSYPEFVSLLGQHRFKPVCVPRGFHPDAGGTRQRAVKLPCFACLVVQSALDDLAGLGAVVYFCSALDRSQGPPEASF